MLGFGLAYSAFSFKNLILRGKTNVSLITQIGYDNTVQVPENVSSRNIQFAFKLTDYDSDANMTDPYYG